MSSRFAKLRKVKYYLRYGFTFCVEKKVNSHYKNNWAKRSKELVYPA